MTLREFREKVNLILYGHKSQVLTTGKVLNVLVSLGALGVLIVYYGFQHPPETEVFLLRLIKLSFAFYVLHYLVRFTYDFHPIKFLRRTWFEGLMMALLTIEAISYNLFDTLLLERIARSFGIESFGDVSTLFIQLYFFIVVLIGAGKGGTAIPRIKLNPAVIFIMVFGLIVLLGTGLLMLPEMTTQVGSMNFIDALFTSTSAACVTGLMVEDAASFFTFKGQVVLLLLIKLGGLNIITFGSFLALATRFGLQAQQHEVLEDFVNKDSILSSQGMLGKVILWATGIELIGAAMFYMLWSPEMGFSSNGERVFQSLFHAVSGFNNAGISILDGGLLHSGNATNYLLHWVMIGLMFFGALGMVTIFELFEPAQLRSRMKAPWKRLSFMSKIALYYSIGITVVGGVILFFTERSNELSELSGFGAFTATVFQSKSAHTAGFNTMDIGAMSMAGLFYIIIAMFIGSASSSTGGGIKLNTLAVIFANVWATTKRAKYTQLFKRSIGTQMVTRAFAIFFFFLLFDLIGVFILLITEEGIANTPGGVMSLIFEQVSAMSTNGLSVGISSQLSEAGRVWISISMFIGRVGTITVAYALGIRAISTKYKYPEGHTMIG